MKFSRKSLNVLIGVHSDLVVVLATAIIDSPVDFSLTDGVRTEAQQKALYAQGRTKAGNIVTNADGVKNKSNHQKKYDGFGHAVDLYPYVNGKIDFEDKGNNLPIIAEHILKTAQKLNIKIEWGGTFQSLSDKPHFELKS